MTRMRGRGAWFILGAAVLAVPAWLGAQTCNTGPMPCSGTPACSSPAGPDVAVLHATTSPCVNAAPMSGGVDLRGTQWETTCCDFFGKGGCTVDLPPFRYWQFNTYKTANIGCADATTNSFFCNGKVDFGQGTIDGYWFAFQSSWGANSGTEGTFNTAPTAPAQDRTVMELTYPLNEGANNHTAFYLISGVNASPAGYDFDRVTGGNGDCGGTPQANVIKPVEVPGLSISGLTCPGSANMRKFGTANANTGFIDVALTLNDTAPAYYTENGKNDAAAQLIAGLQVVYTKTTYNCAPTGCTTPPTGEPEPTSSNYFTGNWQPVLDPADPTKAMALVPWNQATKAVTVSVPKTAGNESYWFATRIVYQDATVNPSGTFDPSSFANGPLVTSMVSAHCGPISAGLANPASVKFESVNATRGRDGVVSVNWTVVDERNTIAYEVVRQVVDPNAGLSVPQRIGAYVQPNSGTSPYYQDDPTADSDLTYIYTVYEHDSNGETTVSQSVTVPALSDEVVTGTTGGRRRGAARH